MDDHHEHFELVIASAKKAFHGKPTSTQVGEHAKDHWFNSQQAQKLFPGGSKFGRVTTSKGEGGHKAYGQAVKEHFEKHHTTQHTEEVEQFGEEVMGFHHGEHTINLDPAMPREKQKSLASFLTTLKQQRPSNFKKPHSFTYQGHKVHVKARVRPTQHEEEELVELGHVSVERAKELVANNPELWRR